MSGQAWIGTHDLSYVSSSEWSVAIDEWLEQVELKHNTAVLKILINYKRKDLMLTHHICINTHIYREREHCLRAYKETSIT